MNRLDAMNLFVRVAELGSFSAAANQLGMERSVVTRQIAALEAHLGAKLMVRSTRHLSLTSAGAAYLERCRVILEQVEEAEAAVMEERLLPSGQLRISLPLSFGLRRLAPILSDFAVMYPDIRLLMDFSDKKHNQIEEAIDLSIRITSRLDPGDIVRRLGSIQLITAAAPEYLARHGEPLHPEELDRHACLGYSPGMDDKRPWHFMVDGQRTPFYLPFRMLANNGDALSEAAARGLGITVQPDFIIGDLLASGRLQPILQAFQAEPVGIYAVLPSNRYVPHRVRVLIEFLSSKLAVL